MNKRIVDNAKARRVGLARGQGGFVMIMGLILLVVVTLLAVSMFRGFGLQERIAGNTREKQRSFEAAQSALQYGEWWLSVAGVGTGDDCVNPVEGNVLANMRVCKDALANVGLESTWTSATAPRIDYVPAGMAVNSGGGFNTTANDINYQSKPALHIAYVSASPDGKTLYYAVSAFAQGGSIGTVSVVQSTYQLATSMTSPDDLP